jgi:hypothetical protein
MGDAGHGDMAAGEVIDLELIRRFIVVMEEVSFTQDATWAASGERAASPTGVQARGNSC